MSRFTALERGVQVCIWRFFMTFLLVTCVQPKQEKSWKKDVSNDFHIGVALEGYSKVVLDCEDDAMAFVIEMKEDFHGVLYSRGSFHSRQGPCFVDAEGGKEFALKFAYNDCGVRRDSKLEGFTTTVVVQFDDDLIFPGDLAFTLVCHDTRKVNASYAGVKSEISLVDPDPSAKKTSDASLTVTSGSNVAIMTSPKRMPSAPNEEL